MHCVINTLDYPILNASGIHFLKIFEAYIFNYIRTFSVCNTFPPFLGSGLGLPLVPRIKAVFRPAFPALGHAPGVLLTGLLLLGLGSRSNLLLRSRIGYGGHTGKVRREAVPAAGMKKPLRHRLGEELMLSVRLSAGVNIVDQNFPDPFDAMRTRMPAALVDNHKALAPLLPFLSLSGKICPALRRLPLSRWSRKREPNPRPRFGRPVH